MYASYQNLDAKASKCTIKIVIPKLIFENENKYVVSLIPNSISRNLF